MQIILFAEGGAGRHACHCHGFLNHLNTFHDPNTPSFCAAIQTCYNKKQHVISKSALCKSFCLQIGGAPFLMPSMLHLNFITSLLSFIVFILWDRSLRRQSEPPKCLHKKYVKQDEACALNVTIVFINFIVMIHHLPSV